MFRRRGIMLTDFLRMMMCLTVLWLPSVCQPISIGNLTFSLASEDEFVAKRVLNNNKTARIYQATVIAIDRPGQDEHRFRPADGELLFAPRQLILQAGESEYFKFYYRGPKDNRERYYRVSFKEIPSEHHVIHSKAGGQAVLEPVIVMDAILVVRPRQVQFKWHYDSVTGTLSNTGNTWFKVMIKPGCHSTEEDGSAWYMRPGDVLRRSELKEYGEKLIVYNERFIKISHDCERE